MPISQRARATLSIAALWSAAWSVPGAAWIARLEMHRSDGLPFHLPSFVRDVFLNWTVIGTIGGALFALTLAMAERRRSSLDALSMRRVAAWGAIGGAAFPLLLIPLVPLVAPEFARHLPAIHDLPAAMRQGILAGAVYGVLGAISAAVSLRLARRARPGRVFVAESSASSLMSADGSEGLVDVTRAARTPA